MGANTEATPFLRRFVYATLTRGCSALGMCLDSFPKRLSLLQENSWFSYVAWDLLCSLASF